MPSKERFNFNSSVYGSSSRTMIRQLRSLQGSLVYIFFWPLLFLILIALLWFATYTKIRAEKEEAEKTALRNASSLAIAYAQDLRLMVEQIDQLTLLVKYEWEKSHEALRLQDMLKQGIGALPSSAFMTIVNADGIAIKSTLSSAPGLNLASRDYFRFHIGDRTQALHIGSTTAGKNSGKTIMQFTRRLEKADGSFDGIVLVSVAPSAFFAFYDRSILGKSGLLALASPDGTVRIAGIGGIMLDEKPSSLMAIPKLDKINSIQPLHVGQWFIGQQARFVAWENLKTYPLIAMVGLSEEESLTPYLAICKQYRNVAIVGSSVLAILTLTAMLLSLRLMLRKQREIELQQAYRLATENSDDGFFVMQPLLDEHGITNDFAIVDSNQKAAELLGKTTSSLIGKQLSSFYPQHYFHSVRNVLCEAMKNGLHEEEIKMPISSHVPIAWMYRRILKSGSVLVMTLRDISRSKSLESKLHQLINKDPLTGLPNRAWLLDFLPSEIERANASGGMFALLFIDLRNADNIHDPITPTTINRLSYAVAERLKLASRPTDYVALISADIFTIVLSPVADHNDATRVAERIAEVLSQPFETTHSTHMINASIGLSLFPQDGQDAEALLRHADIAMSQMKLLGKSRHYSHYTYTYSSSEKLNTFQQIKR
jgi:diguanylate cyclase (GGDEF)-like protein/PAS domain S-box-containing protein